jgi:hypothetical protein
VVYPDGERAISQLTLPPLDLTVVEDDVARFLAPDGRLCRIYVSDEDALEFQLDAKCGTRTFNAGCLAEAARKRQVQLIGCSTTTTRILRLASVTTIDALADLDLAGMTAQRIRRNPDFSEDLAVLQRRAQVRRTMLPGGKHALVQPKRERSANSRSWRSTCVKTSVRSRVEGLFDNLARLFECPLQAILPAR